MAEELTAQLADRDGLKDELNCLLSHSDLREVLAMPRPFSRLKNINLALMAIKRAVHDERISVMPTYLILANTQTCNLRCPFCASHGTDELHRQYNSRENDLESIFADRLCQEALPYVDKVWLSLVGEGLNVKPEEIIKYGGMFLRYGNHMSLSTNGVLLDQNRVAALLPACKHFAFSLDGASPRVFEALRLNARFDKVLRNIKRLTLACEFLPPEIRPELEAKITICGSNVHELPAIVKLSKLLGIPNVYGNFMLLPYGYNHISREAIAHHMGRYNYWRRLAIEVAEKEGVNVRLTPEFSEVAEMPGIEERRDLMIISEVPANTDAFAQKILAQLPDLELEALALACEVMRNLKRAHEEGWFADRAKLAIDLEKDAHRQLVSALRQNQAALRAMAKSPDETHKDCWYLNRYIDVRNDGDSRLCCNGANQFDILREGKAWGLGNNVVPEYSDLRAEGATVRRVFNGPVHNWVSRKIVEDSPPFWCQNCEALVRRPNGEFLAELLGSGAVRQNDNGRFISVTNSCWRKILDSILH